MLSTFDKSMKPMTSAMETWTNLSIQKMGLSTTLKRWVFDALFSVGIVKVALATPAEAANSAWAEQAGKPFAAVVDLDDWVYDYHARDFREAWKGHRVRVPKAAIDNDPRFNKQAVEAARCRADSPYNPQGDEKVKQIGPGWFGVDVDEVEEMVDLWEIYIPSAQGHHHARRQRRRGAPLGPRRPARCSHVVSPDCGPYPTSLVSATVPGNAMPVAPLMRLVDLHNAVNSCCAARSSSQADRLKREHLRQACWRADEDGNRILNCSDGDILRVDNPDAVSAVVQGGSESDPRAARRNAPHPLLLARPATSTPWAA